MNSHPSQKNLRLLIMLLSLLALAEAFALVFLSIFDWPTVSFDSRNVRGNSDFAFGDRLTCHVVHSTYGNNGLRQWQYELELFHLEELESDSPKLVMQYENDVVRWELQKAYEDETYVTLQTPSSFVSDSIGLRKTTGTFVRAAQGDKAGVFQYAIAQKGYCE